MTPSGLKIVLLTRTGRPSGAAILEELVRANKNVAAVVAEKRSSLLLGKGMIGFIVSAVKTHGPVFLLKKVLELARPQASASPGLEELCQKNGVAFYLMDDHNSKEAVNRLNELKPDILFSANTRILREEIIRTARLAALNFHTSKLPYYAGIESIFWALYHGEKEIGVTIHYLEKGTDTGNILVQGLLEVTPDESLETLTAKAIRLGARLAVEAVEKLEAGPDPGTPQDPEKRSYFSWPTPAQRRELKKRMIQG